MTVYSGWEGYQQSLVSAVHGLTPENLRYRPHPEHRSVGEIVGHIAYGRIDWFHRMKAPGSAELNQEITPYYKGEALLHDSVSEDPEALIYWLEASWRMVESNLQRWTVVDLATTFRFTYWEVEYAIPYQWVIWRILSHDIHHGGQLSTLLVQQGIDLPDLGENGGHIIPAPVA